MNEIFELRKAKRAVRNQYKLNLEVPIINQVTFGAKSIRYLGPKIWNSLPFHIKSSESLSDCNETRTPNHLVHKRTLNHLAKLAKWISRLLRARSSLTFRQLWSVDSL